MTARATFKKDDVRRMVEAVSAAGQPVARVVLVDGRIEVIIGDPESEPAPAPKGNPLDRLHGSKA